MRKVFVQVSVTVASAMMILATVAPSSLSHANPSVGPKEPDGSGSGITTVETAYTYLDNATALMDEVEVIGVRFSYLNVVGEYVFRSSTDGASAGRELAQRLRSEYGDASPVISGYLLDSQDANFDRSRTLIAERASRLNRSEPGVELGVARVDILGSGRSGLPNRDELRTQDADPDWAPSWTHTNAEEGNPRKITVALEWSAGRSPRQNNWGGLRGLEFETNLFNDAPGGRQPGVNTCPDNDDNFFTARNETGYVDFWAFESPQGASVAAAKPYFDWAIYIDPCNTMSQTVGVGYPDELPEQPGNPGYWLFQTKVYGNNGTANSSPMSGAVDPVSNNCVSGAIDSNCMGVSDAVGGDVPTVLMFNRNRGFMAPGCVARDRDATPYGC